MGRVVGGIVAGPSGGHGGSRPKGVVCHSVADMARPGRFVRPAVLNALGQENVMKQVAGAVAALALAGSLLLAAPTAASAASLTIKGGASGCCTEAV